MESIYWVFTLKCNDYCAHCYNNSGPRGESVETAELLKVIPNLPEKVGRVILSGGEPLVEMEKLEAVVRGLIARYGTETKLFLQSNGDLIDERRLDKILAMGIDRIDIVSVDRFHKNKGQHVARLKALFESRQMSDANAPEISATRNEETKEYAFWGATEDLWLKGNWARGRAVKNNLAKLAPDHNFCNMWSGALGFLNEGAPEQEIHIQLYRLYPCCPTTYFAMGDVRVETVNALLDRYRGVAPFRLLNEGDIYGVGTDKGLTREDIRARVEALGDVCLWCDEYFQKYYDGPRGEGRRPPPPGPAPR